jgi:hypothetical protein
MQSAPHAIPAMIDVSFPAGFTPADRTFVAYGSIRTRSPIKSDSPARSANASTGANPADDTRFASTNPDSSDKEGTFTSSPRRKNAVVPRIQAWVLVFAGHASSQGIEAEA